MKVIRKRGDGESAAVLREDLFSGTTNLLGQHLLVPHIYIYIVCLI